MTRCTQKQTAQTVPKLTLPEIVVVLKYPEIVGLDSRCRASGGALVHHFLS